MWINWSKIKSYFYRIINGWGKELLFLPVKCKKIRVKNDSLIGDTYYFLYPKNWNIKSPLKGVVSKIYLGYVIKIINQKGLQIILSIKISDENLMPLNKIFECKVKENQKVDQNSILYVITIEKQIFSVNVFIPWQPELLEKISNTLDNLPCFAKIYYRQKTYNKLRFRNHGEY